MHRVFIVDDHPLVRQAVGMLVAEEDDLEVCGQAETAQQALQGIAASKPDVVVADLSLKESSGFEMVKEIRANHPDVLVIILTMHDEALYVERVLRAGARAYVTKEETPDKVITAIRRVLEGKTYLSERVVDKMIGRLAEAGFGENRCSVECLTDRELEIFELYGRGLGTRRIAQKLHRSAKTIQAHRENIKQKLKVGCAEEFMQEAFQWVRCQPVDSRQSVG